VLRLSRRPGASTISQRPDGKQAERGFIWRQTREMFDFFVAERPDHRGGKTESERLQHEAFGCLTGLHVDIARYSPARG
jgi:hypothetical protein